MVELQYDRHNIKIGFARFCYSVGYVCNLDNRWGTDGLAKIVELEGDF